MCDERERLIGYVYDECDDSERRLVDSHLASCEVCRDEIRGLRDVREDLLAWDVPDHGSVWQPFVPAVAAPWYRQVPAWAMAAAASVMFAAGGLGGALTHSVLAARAARTTVVAEAAPVSAVPVAVTPDELTASEQRIVAMLRAEFGERLDAVSRQGARTMRASAPGGATDQLRTAENADSALMPILVQLYNDINRRRPTTQVMPASDRNRAVNAVNFAPGPAGR